MLYKFPCKKPDNRITYQDCSQILVRNISELGTMELGDDKLFARSDVLVSITLHCMALKVEERSDIQHVPGSRAGCRERQTPYHSRIF